ncbi:MAG: nicotinate phosphoribosyltransferase [Pseudomonadota bacterium]|nr:nicotinate phosphoribosyltransferase [Pseudomonadota bacterium]
MDPSRSILLTDLYQLTMLQGYFEQGMEEIAVFELFARDLPRDRGFYVAAGLEQLIGFLEQARFSRDELDWLKRSGRFSDPFVDWLADWRFTGDLDAMPEGTVCFPNEPLVRVTAPMPQAQLVESRLINILHLQTLIASKAARCVLAAPDKLLVDFGMRRAHGAEAGLFAARASYIAGFAGSATVLADMLWGVPSYGTMAHSFIEAHERELDAFEHFARAQPGNVVLLIDTYDTEVAAEKVVALAPRLAEQGIQVKAVRLDSGDLNAHAHHVRGILDGAGLKSIGIFSSGGLDEQDLAHLLAQGAPIDGFGIGTKLDTSADAPFIDCAYKIQEYAGQARRKRSEGKASWPGRKQVYRRAGADGTFAMDLLTLESAPADGEPLIAPVMRGGERAAPAESLDVIRDRFREQLQHLPPGVKLL